MQEWKRVKEALRQDYGRGREIDRMDFFGQPDRKTAEALVENLYGLLFPGLGKDWEQAWEEGGSLLSFWGGDSVCLAFLERLPEIRRLLQEDLQAAYDGDPAAEDPEEILLCYPGFYAVSVYRLAHGLQALGLPKIPRMMTEYAHSRTGIDIHPGARIGRRFFIDHGTGTVIGETAEIGADVKMYQGVTLGGLSTRGGQRLRGKKRHPTIGDHVTVYANATILGGDTVIGRGCVIGAGVFLTESVGPGTTVTGQAQRLQYNKTGVP